MKVSKTITQAFILLSIGLFSLPSCKEKRGCTDTASPNYDPEATLYEFGSCDGVGPTSPTQQFTTYNGTIQHSTEYCSSYSDIMSLDIAFNPSGDYLEIQNITNDGKVSFTIDGYDIYANPKVLTSSYPYTEVTGGDGVLWGNTIEFTLYLYDYECGSTTKFYSGQK